MAIVKMSKLSVIGMNAEKPALLKELMDLGVVEVSGSEGKLQEDAWKELVVKDGDEVSVSAYDKKLARAEAALAVLAEHAAEKAPMFRTRKQVTVVEYEEQQSHEDEYAKQVEEILTLSERLNTAFADGNAAEALSASLSPWLAYELPLEMTETERLKLSLGVMPPGTDVDSIAKDLAAEGCECTLEELGRDREQCYLSLWYFKEDEDRVLGIVKAKGYANAALGDLKGPVHENMARCAETQAVAAENREVLIAEIREKAEFRRTIEYYCDMMRIRRDEAQVRSRLLTTEETFCFDGWTPKAAAEKVEALLSRYTCWHELTEPEEEDDVPVRLRNSRFITPVEFITQMYALPSWKEIDPTSIFTMFYIVFFGIMFGDVGYGLILCLVSGIMLKRGGLYEGGAYKLMKVLFYSGISSIFWGVMFGSFFGDLIPVFAKTFLGKTVVINPLWLDPAKSPMVFLVFSCGLGVVHLFVGMGIKAYGQIRSGHFLDACKDVFSWYLIVLGLILWLFGTHVSAGAPGIGKIMALTGIAGALLLPLVTNKGAGKALGIWDIYSGVTGNLSDILSYSRLLGLGLASTSIAQVFNFLASMGGKSAVGIAMFIVIGLLGHGLNFAINALGAFVHSCRLQYVEFFGKFYEGGGREFEPFCKDTKYINVIEEGK